MELKDHTLAFSALSGMPVVDQNGKKLGRVFEIRAHHQRDGTIVLDELVIGRRALLVRLRGPSVKAEGIPLENVIELGAERIRIHR